MYPLLIAAVALAAPAVEVLPVAAVSAADVGARGPVFPRGGPEADDALEWVHGEPADLTQGAVVVEVWSTWCGACREAWPALDALQREHPTVVIVALSDGPVAKVERFLAAEGAPSFRVAVDGTGALVQDLIFGGFGGRGLPSAYVVRDGTVVWGGPPEALAAQLGSDGGG
ncbi:MAG: thiol-disulfide isomerase/thioredoxin [Myxococcota bacterium]|jgi:thiol-disulfide isomerase/thioredoxin